MKSIDNPLCIYIQAYTGIVCIPKACKSSNMSNCKIIKDEEYKKELDKHFAPLRNNGRVETWNDRKLEAGSRLNEIIQEELNTSDIIIFMLSSDFLDSYYCYDIEMKKAIEREKRGECKIIPVIVRACMWDETPLKNFLAFPKDGKPIEQYERKDDAYLEIAKGVRKIVQSME